MTRAYAFSQRLLRSCCVWLALAGGLLVTIGWAMTEAARVACCFAFEVLGLGEIVSFTVPENRRSRAVMERIGMTHDEHGDFDHPKLPEGHPLRRHVLYRLAAGAAKSTRLDPSTATRDRLGEARGRARIHAQVQARFDEFELHQLETNRPGD